MTATVTDAAQDWAVSARRRREHLSPTERALLEAVEVASGARAPGPAGPVHPPALRHPFPGNTLMHVERFGCESSVELSEKLASVDEEERTPTEDLASAILLTSDAGWTERAPWDGAEDQGEPMHRPVLDLDMPCTLLESSSRGHHHLLIDRPITWTKYAALLDALADAGLLERGYTEASKRRGCSAVRVPWWPKGTPPPPAPRPAGELTVEDRLDPWAVPA